MTELKYSLERRIVICAQRAVVFRYFTDSRRFADWWGKGSSIQPKPGGSVKICFSNDITVSGKVVEVEDEARIVFTYGFDSGQPIPPEGSLVTITFRDHPEGTELVLRHDFSDESARDHHIQGWRHQLAVFANVVCREQHSGLEALLDQYFAVWGMQDAEERRRMLENVAMNDLRVHDAFTCTSGLDDLNAHLSAAREHMPGVTIVRDGQPQQCQGSSICGWIARRADGSEVGHGYNIFDLSPDCRIRRVVGFWLRPQSA